MPTSPEPRRVAANAIISVPVPRLSIDELRKLDTCFGLSADDFEVVHDDEDHWFRLLRCKVHQRYFLEDTRGDVGVYTRTILVSDDRVMIRRCDA